MTEALELWAFALSNLGLFLVSSVLTALCYHAYRRKPRNWSFALATIGFGFVVVGGLVEPVYVFGISPNTTLNDTELFYMQGFESILLALGLGLIFYAITQFREDTPSVEEKYVPLTDEERSWMDGD